MSRYYIFFTVALSLFIGCTSNNTGSFPLKHHSYSNSDDFVMKHLHWNAILDFNQKKIIATAQWRFQNNGKASRMILDVHNLDIKEVRVGNKKTDYRIGKHNEMFGAPLIFTVSPWDTLVEIDYSTAPTATALQWMQPSQTADKTMPYLFTQCESINTRTIIPCMDVPSERITYSASIQAPKGMMVLMSAENPQAKSSDGKYQFNMPIAIPTYLIALAAGDIAFKAIDSRTGVYAEPSVVARAAAELSDIPRMIEAAEAIAGPYSWQRYDVLIQPPSFPIGGMENPKLTFATPTILAGDKSLVSLIAHELAHSWSGNTVTNSTWSDLWLNEGFTTYFERRIMEKLAGKDYADMLWELSYQDLQSDLADSTIDSRLALDLEGKDPEEAFSNIPYEKGAHFLWLVEQKVGRVNFDKAMTAYFSKYAFVPMDTKTCLQFLDSMLFKDKMASIKDDINIKQWVYEPGLPANCPRANKLKFNAVDTAIAQTLKGILPAKNIVASWTAHEYLYYLRGLKGKLSLPQVISLDKHFNFSETKNSEIAFEWYLHALKYKYVTAYPKISDFLLRVGRKKFVKPLYSAMIEEGKADQQIKQLCDAIYKQASSLYHPETRMALESLFK